MSSPSPFALHLRSYGALGDPDRHGYAQLVLPLRGGLALEIEGRTGRLDALRGALIAPGAWHAQAGEAGNQSLILDLDAGLLARGPWQRLLERPFPAIGPAARKLVEFMGIVRGSAPAATVQGWAPLLLDTLAQEAPQPLSRLAALTARIEAEPGLPWDVERMARVAGLSASRLHALFREELGASPRAWLAARRLELACAWLAGSARPIADIALAAGFADQSGLTRAMRLALDTTPAAYRREHRRAHRSADHRAAKPGEPVHKTQ